eukprot:scaffold168_cov124-Cylindrotheca_fusiformis.AAC.9
MSTTKHSRLDGEHLKNTLRRIALIVSNLNLVSLRSPLAIAITHAVDGERNTYLPCVTVRNRIIPFKEVPAELKYSARAWTT